MSVKLYYFDGLGRAEVSRWIMNYGGINFEEVRFDDEIPDDIKAKCRWGQVPLVELDGNKSLTQSVAISRYFARKCNLVPEDPYQAALCDEYVDSVQDLLNSLYTIWYLPDGKDKDDKTKAKVEENKKKFYDVFDSILKTNGNNHLVGDKLTWADLWLAYSIDEYEIIIGSNIAEGRVYVNKLKESVMSQPKIKAWLDKRPKAKF